MIMPVSAAQSYAKPSFRGVIRNTDTLGEVVKVFTKMERTRWDNITNIAEKTNDNMIYQVSSKIKQIGDTIIKSLQVFGNDSKLIAEEVYGVTRCGRVFMYDRQTVARKVLELFEGIYQK